MTPEEYRRKFMCNSIAADLRAAALQADDWGHELREAAWQGWMLDNTWAFHEVAGVIESVRSRKEWQR